MRTLRIHLMVWLLLATCIASGLADYVNQRLVDWRFDASRRPATGEIVVVAIDPRSIAELGVWPWPRQVHAQLLDQLATAHTADIAFDIDFSSASTPEGDRAFAEALERAGGSVVLASFRQFVDAARQHPAHVNRPLPIFSQHSWPSLVNVALDPDGIARRYPFGDTLDGSFVPSMGALLSGRHLADHASFQIDFGIDVVSIPVVSYVDVLRGDAATLKALENRRIIVGATAVELGDRFNVPNGKIIAGPVLQALAAESVLQGRALVQTSAAMRFVGPVVLMLVMLLVWRRLRPRPKVLAIAVFAAISEGIASGLQSYGGVIVNTSLVHVAGAAYLIAIAIDEIDFRGLLGRIAEQRFQRIAMSLGDGLVCADQYGRITVWNPGAQAIFGYSRDQIIGSPFDKLIVSDPDIPFSLLTSVGDDLSRPGGELWDLKGLRANGDVFSLEVCFSGWKGTDGFQYGAILRDVTERKREAERIRYLAEYDMLTGLANRNTLDAFLRGTLPQASQNQSRVDLIIVGLDRFQVINTMKGHEFGDRVLRIVADRLRDLNPDAEMIARVGGDEFAIVFVHQGAAGHPEARADVISQAFSQQPLVIGNWRQTVPVRLGIASNDGEMISAETLLGNAQLALNRAKKAAAGTVVPFVTEIRDELQARVTIEAELVRAYEAGQFELFYQPQIELESGKLIGVESLIRWRHPERGLISPGAFMPIINASTISDRVAFWVLETACRQGRAWQDRGHQIRMGINLSPSLIESGDLLAVVKRVLEKTQIEPSLVELEVTEDIVLTDDVKVLEMFRAVQDLRVRVVFDDFGTGFAGLSYLKKFPLDGLKIDQTFVRDLNHSKDDMAIVSTLIVLSKMLGRSVIAEGIEDAATVEKLRSMGCHEGQGYHFGRPLPLAEFEAKFLSSDFAVEGLNDSQTHAATKMRAAS